MMKIRLFLLISFFLFAFHSYGQAQVYTNADNISDIAVRGDYVWCATRGGIVRWDTRDKTKIKYTTADGLAYNQVDSIAIDSDGTVWAGTFSKGTSRFDGQTWSTFSEPDYDGYDFVSDIAIDDEGVVWIAHFHTGLTRWDGETWTVYTMDDGLADNHVTNIAFDRNGVAWIGTHGGISRFDGETFENFTVDDGLPCHNINAVAVAPDSMVWVGTRQGIVIYDGKTWSLLPLELEMNNITSIVFDATGVAWLGSLGAGVLRHDGVTLQQFTEEDGLPTSYVSTLAIDHKGVVWGGYSWDNVGLFRYRNGEWAVYAKDDGLADNEVLDIAIDSCGDIWAATPYYLSRFNGDSWTTYRNKDCLQGEYVTSLAAAPGGDVWVGTTGGVFRYDGNQWTLHNVWQSFIENDSDRIFCITALEFDSNGTLWAGTYGCGISCYDGETWMSYTEDDGLPDNRVSTLAAGSGSSMWVGTIGGLCVYSNGVCTTYSSGSGWIGDQINALGVGHDGVVWVGILGGISRLDGTTWISFMDDDAIAHSEVKSIAVDNEGLVWIGTGCNLFRFDGETYVPFVCDENQSNIPVNSILVSTNGLLFGTQFGIYRYGQMPGVFKSVAALDLTGIEENDSILPASITIGNYPNPFNTSTTIEFILHEEKFAELVIYNIMGQKVRTLSSENMTLGRHTVRWDGKDDRGWPVSSGVYLSRLIAGSNCATHSILLLR